ncbi:hypothetical protein SmJEL517_g00032 [Synchytrium microbalum]|uniref:Probable ubiquitin carboxyl-terminal hydrolase MINDY-4 n=1 Tax=Synchytrium microbalum TaxID=1806994 RepID=A0A507CK41_9FUNG|nr:uncharacterized protein SmJEL517_g00032 [Synchytrium microbalum]TPX38255.1 hypothetical protein SmJEL517_g00032 [Synchytrium microbalum]
MRDGERPRTAVAPPRTSSRSEEKQRYGPVPLEVLAASLVKEYLSARGYRSTVDAFLIDSAQRDFLVTSKSEMARSVGILKAAKKNKALGNPLKSLLEVLVDTHVNPQAPPVAADDTTTASPATVTENAIQQMKDPHFKGDFSTIAAAIASPQPYAQNGDWAPLGAFTKSNPRSTGDVLRPATAIEKPEYASPFQPQQQTSQRPGTSRPTTARVVLKTSPSRPQTAAPSRPQTAAASRLETAAPSRPQTAASYNTEHSDPFQPSTRPMSAHRWNEPPFVMSDTSSADDNCSIRVNNLVAGNHIAGLSIHELRNSHPAAISKQSSLIEPMVVDFEDNNITDHDMLDPSAAQKMPVPVPINHLSWQHVNFTMTNRGIRISISEVQRLRAVVWPGDGTRPIIGDEWKGKGFSFWDSDKEVSYGLVQLKGGPCGLLAAVQAFVIKHMLFGETSSARNGRLRPTTAQCRTALVSALTELIWQATNGQKDERKAIVALMSSDYSAEQKRMSCYPDGVTEKLDLYDFCTEVTLWEFIDNNLIAFTGNGPQKHGLMLLLYSVVLTRGIDTVAADMDEPDSRMIGKYGYCTQELVNLLLLGEAISNVFDGDIKLDSKVLRGIQRPSQIGYLSLFEHYDSMKVGSHFKNPSLPIFIICSESHYTVLFATERNTLEKASRKFPIDVFYYDQLAGMSEETRLTLSFSTSLSKKRYSELTPPLELVIRTKWSNCVVEWNGSEALL